LDGGGEAVGATLADARSMATTERQLRSVLDGEVSLQPTTPDMRAALGDRSRPSQARSHLIACSRCLRVLSDGEWVRAETVIRDLRTFEHDMPPRFEPVLCPLCTFSIRLRRAEARVSPGSSSDTSQRGRGRRAPSTWDANSAVA
jgi:hypothetical protein